MPDLIILFGLMIVAGAVEEVVSHALHWCHDRITRARLARRLGGPIVYHGEEVTVWQPSQQQRSQ
jgi:hypothetical protein